MEDFARADDVQLLAATPGAPEAFGVFYRRHERTVGAFFMARVRDPELAADLTAETFAAALIGAGRYVPSAPPVAWLLGIARHLWLRSLERRRVEDRARRRLGIVVDLTDDVLEAFERLAGDQRAELLLDELPADQAEAVRGRVLDGASYAELAARMRCSQSVVRKRVSRGLAVLRSRKEAT
jgi:RNA polymerase sigma factor (sigma-70 family)